MLIDVDFSIVLNRYVVISFIGSLFDSWLECSTTKPDVLGSNPGLAKHSYWFFCQDIIGIVGVKIGGVIKPCLVNYIVDRRRVKGIERTLCICSLSHALHYNISHLLAGLGLFWLRLTISRGYPP